MVGVTARQKLLDGDNFIGNYIRYASQKTSAKGVYHLAMAKLSIATILNHNVYVDVGIRIYPNLWILLLGASRNTMKTTSLSIVRYITNRVHRPCTPYERERGICTLNDMGHCTKSHTFSAATSFSYEKILEVLSGRPSVLFAYSEFKSLMAMINNNYNTELMSFLTDMFDCPPIMDRSTQKGEFVIKEPYINIGGCSTIVWFTDSIKEEHISGGFLARFMFVIVTEKVHKKSIHDLTSPSQNEENKVVHQLEAIKEFAKTAGQMRFSKEAELLHRKFELETFDNTPPILDAVIDQYCTSCIKLAIIYAANGLREEISADDMENAINDTKSGIVDLCSLFSTGKIQFTDYGKKSQKIVELIERKGGKLSRRELLQSSNLKLQEFTPIIDTLIQSGRIAQVQDGKRGAYSYTLMEKSLCEKS